MKPTLTAFSETFKKVWHSWHGYIVSHYRSATSK